MVAENRIRNLQTYCYTRDLALDSAISDPNCQRLAGKRHATTCIRHRIPKTSLVSRMAWDSSPLVSVSRAVIQSMRLVWEHNRAPGSSGPLNGVQSCTTSDKVYNVVMYTGNFSSSNCTYSYSEAEACVGGQESE